VDFKAVRDNLASVRANCELRKASVDPAAVVALYEAFTALKGRTDSVREARNAAAAAMKGPQTAESRAALVAQGKALKVQLAELEAELDAAEVSLQREGQRLPNDTHPAVPRSGDEADATVLRVVGSPAAFPFPTRDHVALGDALGLFDFDAGAKASGTRFVYLKGAAALLELALVQWALSRAVAAGFTPYTTPDLVRASAVEKCGFQPRAANTQVYAIEESELCLTGTAEIPLGAIYGDAVLPAASLPLRMAAFGHCFRTEAGAAGAGTRGLYRLHQFSKVELFVISTPEQSDAIHDQLLEFETSLYTELGLHFKVLDMPACDLGAPAYRKFDVEAWMPGLGRFGEISSASNCTDYQARRLNIKFRPPGSAAEPKPALRFTHTLNATACAVPRMIIAILETHQRADGSVAIPAALQPFMGGMTVIAPADAAAAAASA
jgi:seryl-tRNA synthetase